MYRLSFLKEVGIITVIGLIILLFVTIFLLSRPKQKMIERFGEEQFFCIKTNHVINNDSYFHHYLSNIKKNKGVLILGTSESGEFGGLNYHEHLNSDPSIQKKFSTFYGAGRFCEMYFPLIVENPEYWKDQEILVFINPTYWREGLNNSSEEYQTRYLNEHVVYSSKEELDKLNLFKPIFGDVYKSSDLPNTKKVNYFLDENLHKPYYENLRSFFIKKDSDFTPFKINLNQQKMMTPDFIDSLKSLVDPKYNTLPSYLKNGISSGLMFKIDTSSQFRYNALRGMFAICQKYDINATYIIGPYNAILAKEVASEEIVNEYEALITNLQSFFKKHNQKVIDLTELSYVKHSFKDAQHHSEYGGYLIYQIIKKHYENK